MDRRARRRFAARGAAQKLSEAPATERMERPEAQGPPAGPQSAQPAPAAADVELHRSPTPANVADGELLARRQEIARLQERALADAEQARLKLADIERRDQALADRERNLEGQQEELKRQKAVQRKELERLSGLTATQAKHMLITDVEHDARHRAGRALLQIEEETKRDADRRARNILAIAMGRLAGTQASETTTRMVELPNEEM